MLYQTEHVYYHFVIFWAKQKSNILQIYKFVLKCIVCSFPWNKLWITRESGSVFKFLTACTGVVSQITCCYVWRKGKFDYSTYWKTRHNLLHKSINYWTKKVYLYYMFLNRFKEAISLIFLVIYKWNLWGFNFSPLGLTSNLFNGKGPHFKTFTNKPSR